MTYKPVTETQLNEFLDASKQTWKLQECDSVQKITKNFLFSDFKAAFAFMTRIALEAEKLDHHPEWSNVYNRLTITWTTHYIKGLSELDLKMAKVCDSVFYLFAVVAPQDKITSSN